MARTIKMTADPISLLREEQTSLIKDINLLQGRVRELRTEISTIEGTKEQVLKTIKAEIEKTTIQITGFKQTIQDQLNKLSKTTGDLRNNTAASVSIVRGMDLPPPPAAPPPPPMMKAPQKLVIKKGIGSAASTGDSRLDMLNELENGIKRGLLKKSTSNAKSEENTEEKEQARQAEIQRYKNGIVVRKAEITKLISRVNELSGILETVKASKEQYQQALDSQKGLLAQLLPQKQVLQEKLDIVQATVSAELERIEQKRKLEEEARIGKEMAAKAAAEEPKAGSPPPPPPPAPPLPPMAPKTVGKIGSVKIGTTAQKSAPSGPAAVDLSGIMKKAREAHKRQDASRIRNHLIRNLIDIVLKMEKSGESGLKSDKQKLLGLIEDEGYEELKNAILVEVKNLAPAVNESMRRFVNKKGKNDLVEIEKYKNKYEVKEAVSRFISVDAKRESTLLNASKELLQQAELKVVRKELELARVRAEQAVKLAEEKRIAAEEKALETQEKLNNMGVKEGVVDYKGVELAAKDKKTALEYVSTKKEGLSKINEFICEVDERLSNEVKALHEAELMQNGVAKEEIPTEIIETISEQNSLTNREKFLQSLNVESQQEAVVALESAISKTPSAQSELLNFRESFLKKVNINALIENFERKLGIKNITQLQDTEAGNIAIALRSLSSSYVSGSTNWQMFKQSCDETISGSTHLQGTPLIIFSRAVLKSLPTSDEGSRIQLLEKAKFKEALAAINTIALELKKNGYQTASNELRVLVSKLNSSKTEFIEGAKSLNQFTQSCEEAIDEKTLKQLTKIPQEDIKGIKNKILNAVNSFINILRGRDPDDQIKKVSNQMTNIKKSLKGLIEEDSPTPSKPKLSS